MWGIIAVENASRREGCQLPSRSGDAQHSIEN
jgi:hypothetical protein